MKALPLPDPDAELHETARLLQAALDRWKGRRAEVYLRSSARVRATRSPGNAPPLTDKGFERGLAARVVQDSQGTTGFAAASGASDDLARWAFETATTGRGVEGAAPIVFGDPTRSTASDRDAALEVPAPDELSDWLLAAQGRLDRACPGAVPLQVVWVEVGCTVESWVTDGGFRASRARRRAWAMAISRRKDLADAAERPRILAGSRLEALNLTIWAADRPNANGDARLGSRPAPAAVVLEPEAAAIVVKFLVQALHGPGAPLSQPVGRGWRLSDDPLAPDALAGGTFDDAGFPARRVELADGSVVKGVLDGRGHYRRPSFRDPPEAMASHLVLKHGEAEPPLDGYFVHDVRVLPLHAAGCILRVDGVRHRGGTPTEVFVGARVRTSPQELAGCVAAVGGPAIPTAAGVTTPHLVLEGLTLEV